MRKLILTTASVLALGIGGAGLSFAAGMNNAGTNAGTNMPATSAPQNEQTNVNASKGEVRQAQEQLKDQGLYHGAIDGVLGPETKQALQEFQQKNGLPVTATLDQQTMNKLLGSAGTGMGSSAPPAGGQAQPTAHPNQSGLGDHGNPANQTAPKGR